MELPTEETYAKLPIPKPPLLFRYDDLATHDVYSPTLAGYTEDSPLDGLRSTFKQETYIKLFWARYLGVSDSQMATAMGLSFHSADDPEEYNVASERLEKIVDSMRSKTFGPGGYLTKLVQHTVELHDYQAVVFNLARNEMVFGTACTGETDSERQSREVKQAAYRDAKNDMLAKLAAARSEEVVKAKDALQSLQAASRKVRAKEADIKTARLTLQHHEAQDTPWHPTLEASYPTLLHMPPPKLRYAEQHEEIVKLVWEKVWSNDIAANMLWEVRDTINILTSLAENEDFYRTAWVVFASVTWRYCGGVKNRRECKALRLEHVYPSLAAVHAQFFAGEPGLEKLRLSKTSDAKSGLKRPICPMPAGLSFGNKRKKQKTVE
jgi:hypothetical protein